MTHSLAARLTIAITLVILALTALCVTFTGVVLRSRMDTELAQALTHDESAWSRLVAQEARTLKVLLRSAAANAQLRALLSGATVDAKALQTFSEEQKALVSVELLLITTPEGGLLAGSYREPLPALAQLVRSGAPGVLFVGEAAYWTVSRPVEVDGRAVGHLVLGSRFDDAPLKDLRNQRGVELLLRVGSRLVARSVDVVAPEALLAAVDADVEEGRVDVEDSSFRVARLPVGQGLELVLARDEKTEASRFGTAVLLIVGLGLFTALAAGGVIFLLVRRMTSPLRELTAAAARVVAEGDFRGTLEVHSRDEIGRLAASFAEMMVQLRSLLMALKGSAEQLESAAAQLTDSASIQNEAVSQQAVALHETQMAAQQLQESSRAAARRVETIQREAEKASGFGQAGEAAVSGSVGGLTHIRSHVEQIGRTITVLHQRTRLVGDITRTVKDLADQSNVLALNASIEAARSGDQGRAFSVVARQMRSLADQSAGATTRVQGILGDIGRAISEAVRISEGGAREVEGGLEQVQAAGESLRSLAGIIQSNGQTVRSISDAVRQQDAGIAELFAALSSMADVADQIVDRMAASEQAAIQLSAASGELSAIVGRYQL
ncbi:methyl-accepting chemotaxis protein [Myxococcus llanfairpwllgwyngyllgogerychwyrndrobwllllantysiliogogogochensis]|uniref:Methyl-accepting chemotaxis protein n=1 Tax=Myxococcus llanfairpwllgwyngyllgogerychwyrndrobwllllantysiliogogogochensis TaxID=2590453 RepID=A0A540WRZ1_9BACT|nr:methyl-accepting chemotaxis protein [Myxococcus llanfairpwllgwyngyllgogerychwyrndrobwllllantysiliogogogochensis]TQF11763.1 methyl-accepting chemotaxis protein [Myxococcus llanfairpwllgwyngyllgogerychwyrndrobwllllantysiliogogogochensis]